MPTPEAIELTLDVRRALASDALTGRQAKLYSERLRREMGQPGLATFARADVNSYLDEAMWLIDCALIEQSAEPNKNWRRGIRRAAEILEFISQRTLRPAGVPSHLLSAAAYQVAGLPAMAHAQLKRLPADEPVRGIVCDFLQANFPGALERVRHFWRAERVVVNSPEAINLSALAAEHTVMCIGTICMYFKTGDHDLMQRAIEKLHALARGYLHSRDPYSYLLARLTALAASEFETSSLWKALQPLSDASTGDTEMAFRHFARAAYVNCRSVIWPAQAVGIARLKEAAPFVLCTPTGSGKTTVATLAVVQSLFEKPKHSMGLEREESDNLILYLVPSRALAAEVEGRFDQDLRGIGARPVVVTGLYGGIDWGPTDAWIRADRPTIVICTFEKADAILRYLGMSFLHRVRLVVIDEAHMVESEVPTVRETSRELRLELLGTRLIEAAAHHDFRIIALSAVADAAAPALARWVGHTHDAVPAVSTHRSTRQMLGRIEVARSGNLTIRYDLMNGHSLRFAEGGVADTPFVPKPFPQMPARPDFAQPERAMREPALWAALHLAAERPDGSRPAVLISVTQHIGSFAADCAALLDKWAPNQLPKYCDDAMQDDALWERCLASTADYFGSDSVEHRLLRHGIVVHHGKMPGMLARRLKTLVDHGTVRVIIATSTLSEGVNIPVTYLLIPSVYRANARMTRQEFANLIGRAGRPGVSTEGHALVLLPAQGSIPGTGRRPRRSRQRSGYDALVGELGPGSTDGATKLDAASSPLSVLLKAIELSWTQLVNGTPEQFGQWLEQTDVTAETATSSTPVEHLNTLDSFLLSAIEELEQLRGEEIPPADLEEQLRGIWQRSYAFATAHEEERLRRVWLGRGRVLKSRYPDAVVRRQIYRTSLSPRSAYALFARVEDIRAQLIAGTDYAKLDKDRRLAFVGDLLELVSQVPTFQFSSRLGRRDQLDWRQVLAWWLAKDTLDRQPPPKQVTSWYHFAAQNFVYRGSWGLGSVLSLLLDLREGGQPIAAMEIRDWPRSGLPWIAFWLKELLFWGTLEPVAAFLLARGNAVDRPDAQLEAEGYYAQLPEGLDNNEILNPLRIGDWLSSRFADVQIPRDGARREFEVTLDRDASTFLKRRLNVMYLEVEDQLHWIDAAGYLVAKSQRPHDWPSVPQTYHFQLNIDNSRITGSPYLRSS